MSISVAVVGASGRMGKLALELIEAAQDLKLHAALDSRSSLTDAVGADVIFDVTKLEVSQQVVAFGIEAGIPVVVGTSGWSAQKLAEVSRQTESRGTVVVIPNFSIGSMLATKFAAEAARHFATVEIVESHHARKLDSPSGTAIRTAELIAQNREQTLVPGADQQARGQIVAGVPIHSIRMEGISAKQEVILGAQSEVLSITHETSSVYAYSAGILSAIRFAAEAKGLHVGLESVL